MDKVISFVKAKYWSKKACASSVSFAVIFEYTWFRSSVLKVAHDVVSAFIIAGIVISTAVDVLGIAFNKNIPSKIMISNTVTFFIIFFTPFLFNYSFRIGQNTSNFYSDSVPGYKLTFYLVTWKKSL